MIMSFTRSGDWRLAKADLSRRTSLKLLVTDQLSKSWCEFRRAGRLSDGQQIGYLQVQISEQILHTNNVWDMMSRNHVLCSWRRWSEGIDISLRVFKIAQGRASDAEAST